ncbi:Phosphatidylinositol 5-phosphate 4-kinase type-2 beta [Saguinus oedipus]|uniref:Phosphatidylinositol 5-phosphate 4-kinase type-2 beta n=1 Tax=Saguinus oedipus TaxID=9490 RepID=A0ABQ9VQZ8_SAGOE|nr:Phosphatidylinositol 5-phosphate 4-kinase type-2 beta [Saguinus oedipus]
MRKTSSLSGNQLPEGTKDSEKINELSNVPVPVMLMPDDFKAYSKIKVDNHLFNK